MGIWRLLELFHPGDLVQLPYHPLHDLAHIELGTVLPGHQESDLLLQVQGPLVHSGKYIILWLAGDTGVQVALALHGPTWCQMWLLNMKSLGTIGLALLPSERPGYLGPVW